MLKESLGAFWDILYPKNCHLCSKILTRETRAFDNCLCGECVSAMRRTPGIACSFCGAPLNHEAELKTLSCRSCKRRSHPYEKLLACYIYEGKTRDLLHKFKYGNRPYLCKSIAHLMIQVLPPSAFRDMDYLVPVPLHGARKREREFNQAQLLACQLALAFGKPVSMGLKRIRNTKPQSSLKKSEKFSNLKGSFAVTDPSSIKDKNLLIIDDIVTTTATVSEASSVLKNAGAKNISVLAFAKG
jgi:competence protein ComFC